MIGSHNKLFVLGVSHHTAPLETREKCAVADETILQLASTLQTISGVKGIFLLNTCNRFEVYGVAPKEASLSRITSTLSNELQLPVEFWSDYGFQKWNHEMVQHLVEVACGIDSQMVGEAEILGQVKAAWQEQREQAAFDAVLDRLLQKTFQASKWVRTHSGIGRGQVSIGQVATDLAGRIFENLQKVRVLVIGSGEVAEKTLQSLHSRGVSHIFVSSRRMQAAQELANQFQGAAAEFDNFPKFLEEVDIVITSTSAPHFILEREMLQQKHKLRRHRPLFLIDLALPRDIDPTVGEISNVYLYNLDDLATIANENLKARENEVANSRQLIARRAWELWLSLHRRYGPFEYLTKVDPSDNITQESHLIR